MCERNTEEGFKITNDSAAEWALNKIKEEEAERDRLVAVAKERIEFYQGSIDDAERRCDSNTAYLKGLLGEYALTVPRKETKTQESYRLPSGQLIIKKAKIDMVVDNEKLLAYLKENKPDLITITEKPQWAEFKKQVEICGDKVIDTETGEAVEAITTTETPESFTIKLT